MDHDTLYAGSNLGSECYDGFYDPPPAEIAGDVAFYVAAAREAGGPVVELACGTGRVTLPIARAGVAVTGLDASEGMLAIARAKTAVEPEEVRARLTWGPGLLQDFDLGGPVPLVLVPFRSFQLLGAVDDQLACLRCMRRHLAPGGRAIVHLFDPRLDYLTGQTPLPRIVRKGRSSRTGRTVTAELVDNAHDFVGQTARGTWLYIEYGEDGSELRREELTQTVRWIWRPEFAHLAARAGLSVAAEYSDFRGSPPAYGRERVTVLIAA